MPTSSDEQIGAFLDLFDGDLFTAHEALDSYAKQKNVPEHSNAPASEYAQNEIIVSISDVSKHYLIGKQKIQALSSISLAIHKSEIIAITGASGSGKSTLLQIIGCLDKPTSGTIYIENKDTTHLSDAALSEIRKKTIGFIFQSFYLQPFLRLNTNIAVPAMFASLKKKSVADRVELLLNQVGLSEQSEHYPRELSGGQIQRAAIARALINMPSIVLADEPTGNLDSKNSQAIIDLFKAIRSKLGTTIVIVTHDKNIARQADRIIELKDGKIL